MNQDSRNYKELNDVLMSTINGVRGGTIDIEKASAVCKLADSITKNNINAIAYRKLFEDVEKIPFFENKV